MTKIETDIFLQTIYVHIGIIVIQLSDKNMLLDYDINRIVGINVVYRFNLMHLIIC